MQATRTFKAPVAYTLGKLRPPRESTYYPRHCGGAERTPVLQRPVSHPLSFSIMPPETQQRDHQRTEQQQPTRVECRYHGCTAHGYRWEFRDGEYCSTVCQTKHRGREALKSCRYDHTLCFTCLRPLKDIEDPKPDFEFTENGHGWTRDENGDPTLEYYDQTVSADAACGWQHRTQWAVDGEKYRFGNIVTGVICDACGNTDHTHHEACLADRDAIGRLVARLVALDDWAVDPYALHCEYESSRDIDLAVGRAVTEEEG